MLNKNKIYLKLMIEKLTKDIINKLVNEFKKKENKERLEREILNPIISNFSEKIFPYVSLLFIMYSLNLILIIIILVLIVIKNKKNN
jgi:hypothetical protein